MTDQRREQLRLAGAKGGRATVEKYGRWHMSAIGKVGYQTTVARHGVGYVAGIMDAKHYRRRKTVNVAMDLALGKILADS